MHNNSASNSPGGLYSTVPKLCFAYGPEQYVSATVSNFSVEDEVIWTCSGGNGMLAGKIQFIGQKIEQENGSLSKSKEDFAAVVVFNQPTCHLPNHLANPPSNRNLVPVSQLIKKGEGQWQLSTLHSSIQDTNQRFQLVGNCIASYEKIEKISINDFPVGDVIVVETKEAVICGKVMVTGKMKDVTDNNMNDDVTIDYVGLKFDKSLKACYPEITLLHQNKDDRCSRCVGATLAFIPVKLLTYGKRITVGTNTILRIKSMVSNSMAEKASETGRCSEEDSKENKTPFIKATQQKKQKKPPVLFIGNCVALEKGTEDKKVKGIKKGYTVLARAESPKQKLQGVACMVCSINGLENLQQDCLTYVGIRFERSFADICDRDQVVMHCNLQGKPASACKQCEGGKVVFIPADCLLKQKDSTDDGISFQVTSK